MIAFATTSQCRPRPMRCPSDVEAGHDRPDTAARQTNTRAGLSSTATDPTRDAGHRVSWRQSRWLVPGTSHPPKAPRGGPRKARSLRRRDPCSCCRGTSVEARQGAPVRLGPWPPLMQAWARAAHLSSGAANVGILIHSSTAPPQHMEPRSDSTARPPDTISTTSLRASPSHCLRIRTDSPRCRHSQPTPTVGAPSPLRPRGRAAPSSSTTA